MDSKPSDSFITGVDAGGPANLLEQVRSENVKIKEVVHSFNNKIETLIDKQRNEYIQAYENHMQDVQKELHSLREKVADIANDDTKNEKTESLKVNQKKYKEEALKLESDSDEILKKIKKLVRKIYTVEKSRDWMLRRLRKAKQEYNTLIKERNRLFEDWDSHTMSLSLASMSNASSYTLDLRESLKGTAANTLKLNTTDYSTQAHSRVQLDFQVERYENRQNSGNNANYNTTLPALSSQFGGSQKGGGSIKPWDKIKVVRPQEVESQPAPVVAKSFSLPALQPASKQLSKSQSGPVLTATFANSVNAYSRRKSRGNDEGSLTSVPVAERAEEQVNEKLALTRLIALRARRQEVREFLQSCAKSLHRGPWCRVKARPMDKLLEACQEKINNAEAKFRSEELLQLVCELAVYPDTYEALAEIYDAFAPMPANYMSDHEIEASAVVRPAHQLGVDRIADELLGKFGDHASAYDTPHSARSHQGNADGSHTASGSHGVDLEPSDEAVDFRQRLDQILHSSAAPASHTSTSSQQQQQQGGARGKDTHGQGAVPQKVYTRPSQKQKVVGGMLDKDLKAYFMVEDHTRRLSNMGFYEKDDFMNFD